MSKIDFFKEKKEWSFVKDDLLGDYLKLYFSKILRTGRPTIYVDCFAGKGKFGDGHKGSPLIALEIAKEAMEKCHGRNEGIVCNFVEKKFGDELLENVKGYNCKVFHSTYDDEFLKIIKNIKGKNIFVYIDPFGIKHIHFDKFKKLVNSNASSCELLLNLNSFGFIREGCRILKTKPLDDSIPVIEDGDESSDINDIENMNRIANGTYWQDIIHDYDNGYIDGYEAEEQFVNEYCKQLSGIFEYVLQIPIKVKMKNHPKYRMIYATNHSHGYIEMADNMNKRWKYMQLRARDGQISLFDIDFENGVIISDIDDIIVQGLSGEFISYESFLCSVIEKEGTYFSVSEINAAVKNAEKAGKIEVLRIPATTPTGKKATWISYKKKNSSIKVRLRSV